MEKALIKNEEIAQNPDALHSSEKQGSKPKNGSKIAAIICAILAVAGLGFGVYGFFFKKPEAPAQNTDTSNLESELSSLKQKYSVLQNYVKELEASGTEVSEEVKSATSAETTTPLHGVIKDTKTIHFQLSRNITTSVWNGTTNVPYRISIGASNGLLDTCKVYLEDDGSVVKDCDTSNHSGQIVDIIGGPTGNGNGKEYGLYILTDQGEVEFISGSSIGNGVDGLGVLSKIDLPKKAVRLWGDGKIYGRGIMENGEIHPVGGGYYNLVQFEDGTLESIFNYLPEN